MLNLKKKVFYILSMVLILASTCANAKTQDLTINSVQGKLAVTIQTPDNQETYPMVMIFHGLNIDKEMPLLVKIADDLEQAGIASVRFDFNGHGQSEGAFEDMTVLNELEDARKVYAYVRTLPEVTTISLTGHSQGGVIAGMLAGEWGQEKINSVVLLAPAAVLRDNAESGDFFGIKYDADNLPEYLELPDGHKIGKAYLETSKELPIYEVSEKYTGPVLIVHSMNDDLVPYIYGEQYQKLYANSELELLRDMNHNFYGKEDMVARLTVDYFLKNLK